MKICRKVIFNLKCKVIKIPNQWKRNVSNTLKMLARRYIIDTARFLFFH